MGEVSEVNFTCVYDKLAVGGWGSVHKENLPRQGGAGVVGRNLWGPVFCPCCPWTDVLGFCCK